MSLIKSLMNYSILISVTIFFCWLLLGFGDMILQGVMSDQLQKRNAIFEQRIVKEDLSQRKRALEEGYAGLSFPKNDMWEKNGLPPLAGIPDRPTYYCNEGYGLVRYQSDRFGFRNEDHLWDEDIDTIFIGDSFVHGACVNDQDTISNRYMISSELTALNLGIAGYNPYHYTALANIFIPKLMPKRVFLLFYSNDKGDFDFPDIYKRYKGELANSIFSSNLTPELYPSKSYTEMYKGLSEPVAPLINIKTSQREARIFVRDQYDGGVPIVGYEININGQGFKPIYPVTNPIVLSNLSIDSEYSVSLRSLNAIGYSTPSDLVTFLAGESNFKDLITHEKYRIVEFFKLNTIRNLLGRLFDKPNETLTHPAAETAIRELTNLCKKYDCELTIGYIPNSNFWNPDPESINFKSFLRNFSGLMGHKFLDFSDSVNSNGRSKDYALEGIHLSPVGYKLVSKQIIESLNSNPAND